MRNHHSSGTGVLRLAAALAGAAFLAGCASAERMPKAEYESTVVDAYDEVRQAFAGTRVETPEERSIRVAEAQQALHAAADKLLALRPPQKAEEPTRELALALRDYAGELDSLRAAIERGDEEFQLAFNERVATHPAILRAKEAVEELKESGFQLGALAKD